MREARPIAGRIPRPMIGRNAGFPLLLPPGGHNPLNADSGTPGVGDPGIPDKALSDDDGVTWLMDDDGVTYLTDD